MADPLGLGVEAAARGILAIADNHMVGAVRVVSVERGHDPRDFALVPFGGAGPLHGCALADLLGIRRVVIPSAPGVLCADGLLAADLKSEFSRALARPGPMGPDEAASVVSELQQQAALWFEEEGVAEADRHTSPVALMRYHGQGGEIAVPYAAARKTTEANFRAAHRSLYGFNLDAEIELVTLRVEAVGAAAAPPRRELAPGNAIPVAETASVDIGGARRQVPVADRDALGAGAVLAGPMILTQLDTTTFVAPGWTGEVHPSGAILLSREVPQ